MRSPMQTCQACGLVEIVRPDGRGFPPDIAKRRLKKRCAENGCASDPRYSAGLAIGPPVTGMTPPQSADCPDCGEPCQDARSADPWQDWTWHDCPPEKADRLAPGRVDRRPCEHGCCPAAVCDFTQDCDSHAEVESG